jgi:beta-lactamase superfamily II metal-dependent hydrolase
MPKLLPSEGTVVIRMYRIGHGDCFLLAFPRKGGGDPVYVLIDCGFKKGSPAFINTTPEEVVDSIGEATGNVLDLVILTHEHEDHLSAIWRKNDPYFDRFTIRESWLAWTEKAGDPLADQLRQQHKDTLLQLVEARRKLALAVDAKDESLRRVDALLGLELGMDGDSGKPLFAVAGNPENSVNKQGLRLVTRKANETGQVRYLNPKDRVTVSGTDVKAYVLGPPRSASLLSDEDPVGAEGFPNSHALQFTFGAAAAAASGEETPKPFSPRYVVGFDKALKDRASFFGKYYGKKGQGHDDRKYIEAVDAADWRRIDQDWLFSAENLALKLNTGINNTSLVLAFELPKSKKVLLFVGDAQRGNWISWKDLKWNDGNKKVTTRDLLGRTVLYKVGHHGSHNATLNGKTQDPHANLSWMATGKHAEEFTAMITAVNKWATTKNDPPWHHPLPSIKTALRTKSQGRVFQTDEDKASKPQSVSQEEWNQFLKRSSFQRLFFDYVIHDD